MYATVMLLSSRFDFMINLKPHALHVVRYLLFLSSGWFSSEDAGIHGLDILYHQAKQLVAEAEH